MAEKKKKPVISEEERAAQRARRQEESLKTNAAIERRIETLRSLSGMKVLTGTLSAGIPVHASFVSSQDVLLYIRGGASITRIRKGDLIQINCGASPRSGFPCVAVYNGKWVFALPKDDTGHSCFNLSSRCPEDDSICLNDDQFIGNVVYVVPDPSAGGRQTAQEEAPDPASSECAVVSKKPETQLKPRT